MLPTVICFLWMVFGALWLMWICVIVAGMLAWLAVWLIKRVRMVLIISIRLCYIQLRIWEMERELRLRQ